MTVASIYVPNGGKDFPAKMRFLEAMDGYARGAAGGRPDARPVRRPERRAHREGRAPEGAQAARDRPAAGGAGARSSGSSAAGLVDVGRALDPDNDELFTWWAPWRNMRQRNIGWRLDYVLASEALAAPRDLVPGPAEVGTSDHAPVVATFA